MKGTLLIIIASVILILLPACNYNGKATIIVKNIGDLTTIVEVESSKIALSPGQQEEFTLTWPGHDDVHTNMVSYPPAFKETMWDSKSIWLKNGETKYFEVEFYIPE